MIYKYNITGELLGSVRIGNRLYPQNDVNIPLGFRQVQQSSILIYLTALYKAYCDDNNFILHGMSTSWFDRRYGYDGEL